MRSSNRPPVAVAALAALFLIGGGQLVNRQWLKAAALLVSGAVLLGFTAVLGMSSWIPGYLALGLIPLSSLYIASYIDAIRIATRIRKGEAVGPWQCF